MHVFLIHIFTNGEVRIYPKILDGNRYTIFIFPQKNAVGIHTSHDFKIFVSKKRYLNLYNLIDMDILYMLICVNLFDIYIKNKRSTAC